MMWIVTRSLNSWSITFWLGQVELLSTNWWYPWYKLQKSHKDGILICKLILDARGLDFFDLKLVPAVCFFTYLLPGEHNLLEIFQMKPEVPCYKLYPVVISFHLMIERCVIKIKVGLCVNCVLLDELIHSLGCNTCIQ